MKRILRVIPSLNPRQGGPVSGIRAMTPLLAERGIATTILSNDESHFDLPAIEGAELIVCGPSKYGVYGYAPAMSEWLIRNHLHFDAVFVHGCWQFPGWAVWKALSNSRVPYFVYPHGMLDPWFKRRYPLKHLKKWLYWPWAEYRILRDAKAVLYTSADEQRLARKSFWLFQDNPVVVPYGIVETPGIRSQVRTSQHSGGKVGPIVYLGRIHPKKGIEMLLDVWSMLPQDQRPGELHIYGVGEAHYVNDLKKKIRLITGVTFFGDLWGDDKVRVLAESDALILPSFQENFGLVLVEALSVGTPVLSTSSVNIAEEIAENGAGLVADATVQGVRHLLSQWKALSVDSRSDMRTQARELFTRRFDLRQTMEQWISIIDRLCAQS